MTRLLPILFSLSFALPTILCSCIPYVPPIPSVLSQGSYCHDKCLVPATSDSPFWMEKIKHQGKAPFKPDPGYQVFRNVKDFGAFGDGIHDDTASINAAIQAQSRCGLSTNCDSSTVSPAVVYFPSGIYLVSSPIIPYYYTQLIGDARTPPTLLAAANFSGFAVIDVNPYLPGGAQYFQATNNFFRSIRNFVIDVRNVPPENQQGTGIHWQVAQATSLINIVFQMSNASNTAHQGIWMENGSAGVMGDLVFNGGKFGIWGGNQQFTIRNITINNAQTAVYSLWNWGFTYQGITINNCQVGFDIVTGGVTPATQTTGAQAIIDANVFNTPIFVRTSKPSTGSLAGSIVLSNVKLSNVPVAVGVLNGGTVLPGSTGTVTIPAWAQGNVFHGTSPTANFVQGFIPPPNKNPSLLSPDGSIVSKTHPQYENLDVISFVSVRDFGAVGDGVTDDTIALQFIFTTFGGCKIIFLDAGFYILTETLTIPAGTRLVGEAWSVLAGKGERFQNQADPKVVIRVGETGSHGITEITDVVFTTVGPTPGAIVVEWNVKQPDGVQAGTGMWDSHIRLGGATGTNLDGKNCPKSGVNNFDPCFAAFMGLHLTSSASGYFEGTWIWLADHDLDLPGENQISLFSGRGLLSESKGPVWMIGTAVEHHTLYQYNLVNAEAHYIGLMQTETPYYQPLPASPTPFQIDSKFHDPNSYSNNAYAWGLTVTDTKDTLIFGAGLYSFFYNYSTACTNTQNCQEQILNIDQKSNIGVYSLSTVGTTFQLSDDAHGVINQNANKDGFASTATVWTRN